MPEASPALERLAKGLRREREWQALSRSQLAKLSGVDESTIYAIEMRRYQDARLSTLDALAEALEIPIGALLI